MARSRRALLRKGNVTDIAEARKKREEKQQARELALANARVGTLDEASRQADAIQAAIIAEATDSQALSAAASATATHRVAEQAADSARSGVSAATGSVSASSAGATIASASAAQGHPPGGSAQIGAARVAQSANSGPAEKATKAAARREHDQPDDDAAGRKARAEKKNANRTFNREKVEAIKKAIANGTYQINATRTADKFIERESFS